MAVTIGRETKVGDLWVNTRGEVYQILSFCTDPTITMQNMVTGATQGGSPGCLNLKPFKPLQRCKKEELLPIVAFFSRPLLCVC